MRLGDEDAVVLQHLDDAVDDRVHVLDMGETIGRRDHAGRAVLALDLARHLGAEIALERRDAALIGDVADVGRLDAEHAVAALLEIRQQRAVVGADIDDEIVACRGRALRRLSRCRSAKLSRSSLVVPLV